ncbi:hypothetical protein LXL04_021888 [Taraxacum kok-saghyz]
MKKKMMIATYTASATPTRLRLHQNINQFCPLEFHTWENVPNENKEEMIDHFHPSNHLFPEARDMFCPPDQEKTSTSCDMDDLSDEE